DGIRDDLVTGVQTCALPISLPGRYYNAPEIWAEERERILARRWICVGRDAELGQPGDYAVRAVGGESVMIVRGQDGAVRAFYNRSEERRVGKACRVRWWR